MPFQILTRPSQAQIELNDKTSFERRKRQVFNQSKACSNHKGIPATAAFA
jgi:hypothetical protein